MLRNPSFFVGRSYNMVEVSIRKLSDTKDKAETLVLFAEESGKSWTVRGVSIDVQGLAKSLANEYDFEDLKSGLYLRHNPCDGYKNLCFLGRDKSLDAEKARRLVAQAVAQLKSHKSVNADLHFESLSHGAKDQALIASAASEAVLLATYEYNDFKTADKDKSSDKKKLKKVSLLVNSKVNLKNLANAVKDGVTLAECTNYIRRLGDTPGNLMTPNDLANAAVNGAKGTKLKVTVWDKPRIKKEKMGGLIGVNLGGGPDCRFIIMEYHGGAKSKKPVVFVGKGLTFDAGGISIKPANGMEEMKYDMCGGAAVIGAMLAIAKLGLKVNAIGLVPATENMLGPMANKPGDILTARNGKTVEVYNTDAEGRLILMDALSYASELKPAAIFDAATLTGAVVVALGNSYTGVFTRNQKLMEQIKKASERSGEWVWPMPINDHHVEDMRGTLADLCNVSSFKGAGSSTAAAFMEQFVDKDIPWAHFDIAGTAWAVGNRINYCPKKGASGVLVRTFVELAKDYR
jgi:leucyl aminopeptidase